MKYIILCFFDLKINLALSIFKTSIFRLIIDRYMHYGMILLNIDKNYRMPMFVFYVPSTARLLETALPFTVPCEGREAR